MYLPSIDKHITINGLYSNEEIEFFDQLEIEWKNSLPKFDIPQLLKYFPEGKKLIREKLEQNIEQYRKDAIELKRIEQEGYDVIFRKSPKENEWFWNIVLEVMFLEPLRQSERKLKRDLFYLSLLKGHPATKGITPENILKAKEYLLTDMYSGTLKRNKNLLVGVCPFHIEKTGSFTIYEKENNWHCFGCGVGGDSIDFVMKQQNISFIDAVKKLQ